jgi:hypothetical protein
MNDQTAILEDMLRKVNVIYENQRAWVNVPARVGEMLRTVTEIQIDLKATLDILEQPATA